MFQNVPLIFFCLIATQKCLASNLQPKTRSELEQMVGNISSADSTLILAHVIFRHGARTNVPEGTYLTDPYKYSSFWPYTTQQLTKEGQLTAYKLGIELRKRYGSFLGNVYNPQILEAVTSQKIRTEASLQCVLAALFPPNEEDLFLSDLPWRPTTYNVFPQGEVLNPFDKCENYWKITSDTSDPMTLELYAYVEKHSGEIINNNSGLFMIRDSMEVTKRLGRPQPDWLMAIYPEPLETVALRTYHDLVEQRLFYGASNLMRKIVDDTLRKLNGTMYPPRKKMILYSGHEQSIVFTLGALDAYQGVAPGFSSYIALELHYIDNIFAIKVVLQNYQEHEPEVIRIFNHTSDFYPLDKFLEKTKWLVEGPPPTCP